MSYDYIRRYYGSSFEPGMRVRHTVTKGYGTVAPEDPGQGHYVQVKFDGQNHALPCHPEELEVHYKSERIVIEAGTAWAPGNLMVPLGEGGRYRVAREGDDLTDAVIIGAGAEAQGDQLVWKWTLPEAVEDQRLRRYGPDVQAAAKRAVDEVFGPEGDGPFKPGPGATRGGRSMPVYHSEETGIDGE